MSGDYTPLVPLLKTLKVGNYLLELCTPRAGEIEALQELPLDRRIGIGVVNPKTEIVESVEEIVSFTVPANVRSRRVMEKIGMTHTSRDDFEHPLLPGGHPLRRHVLYRIGRGRFVQEGIQSPPGT